MTKKAKKQTTTNNAPISEQEALQIAQSIVYGMAAAKREERIAEACRHIPGLCVTLSARSVYDARKAIG